MWAELCFASQESVGDDGGDTNHTDFRSKCFILLRPVQNSSPQCNVSEPQESLNQKKPEFLLEPSFTSGCFFLWVGGVQNYPLFGGTKDKLWHFQSESRSPHTFFGQPLDSIRAILESRVLPATDTLLPGTHCQCWTPWAAKENIWTFLRSI